MQLSLSFKLWATMWETTGDTIPIGGRKLLWHKKENEIFCRIIWCINHTQFPSIMIVVKTRVRIYLQYGKAKEHAQSQKQAVLRKRCEGCVQVNITRPENRWLCPLGFPVALLRGFLIMPLFIDRYREQSEHCLLMICLYRKLKPTVTITEESYTMMKSHTLCLRR